MARKRSKILSKVTVAYARCLSTHLFRSVYFNLAALEPVVCVCVLSVTEARPVCRLRFVAGTGAATGAVVVVVALLWHRVVF